MVSLRDPYRLIRWSIPPGVRRPGQAVAIAPVGGIVLIDRPCKGPKSASRHSASSGLAPFDASRRRALGTGWGLLPMCFSAD